MSVAIGVLFVVLCYMVSFVSPMLAKAPALGLWPMIFSDIVIECNRSPDVARKYYY
jgi:hypothetical protein